ncbi:MAG: pitrilysin family protein [Vulcanimicrobiaceae bacterium]
MPSVPSRLVCAVGALVLAFGSTQSAPRAYAAPLATRAHAAPLAVTSDVLKATLANGLRVVIVRNALAPVVSTDLTYLVGSRDDPADVPGMAHAQEHMMFRGTKNLSTGALGTIATALGGTFNAETSDTLTQYEFTVPATHLDAVLRIESDRMRDVIDAQSQWENERGAIDQEVARDESSPGGDFFRDAQAFAFAGTPYARQGVGTRAAFARLTGPQIHAFHDRWYAPNNAVLVIAGDVDSARALASVRSFFETIPKRAIPQHPHARFEPLARKTIVRPTTLTYPLAAVAYRLPGIESPDFLASFILQQALGATRGPFRSLVDRGEALDAQWVAMPYFPEGQLGMATAALGPGGDPLAKSRELEAILHDIARDGISRELFETTKRQAIAGQELSRNSISALASDWATTIALDNEPSIAREQELLAGVTLADVDRVARTYLVADRAIVGALTPTPTASNSAPASPPQKGPERPLPAQAAVTSLPPWAADLVSHVEVAAAAQPEHTKLPNGLTVIVRPATISDSVVAYGAIRSNAALQEPAGKEGVASVLDGMFPYGTRARDRSAFLRAQDDIDTQIGGGANFGLQTTSKSFARAVDLLAENERTPRFDRATFELARRRALEELKTALGGTASYAERQAARKLLPAGDPTLREATPASLEALTLDDVRAYYERTFRPDLATIVVAGNITPDVARGEIARAFGSWRATGEAPHLDLAPVPVNAPGDVRVAAPQLGQDSVTLEEMLALDRGSPAYPALQLGNAVLGGGALGAEQSRLFRDIRQNAGLVYTIGSQLGAERTRARFSIDFASAPSERERIEALVRAEIERMRKEPVGAFELSLAKAAIVRRASLAGASISGIAQSLLHASLDGAPLDRDRSEARAIVATSAAQVRDAFAAQIRSNDFVRVVIGP